MSKKISCFSIIDPSHFHHNLWENQIFRHKFSIIDVLFSCSTLCSPLEPPSFFAWCPLLHLCPLPLASYRHCWWLLGCLLFCHHSPCCCLLLGLPPLTSLLPATRADRLLCMPPLSSSCSPPLEPTIPQLAASIAGFSATHLPIDQPAHPTSHWRSWIGRGEVR